MVGRMDLKAGVHEVEQSRCVDHVSSHQVSLTGPAGRSSRPTGTNPRSAPVSCQSARTWPKPGCTGSESSPRAIFIGKSRPSSHQNKQIEH
jgi:hypothetical protein